MCDAGPLSRALMLRDSGIVSIVGAGGKTTLMFRLARELSGAGHKVLTTTTTKVMMPTSHQARVVIIEARPAEVLEKARSALVREHHVFAGSGPHGSQGKISGFEPEAIDAFWASGLFRWVLVEADGAAQRPLKAPAAHEPVIPIDSRWVIAVAGMDAIGRPLDDASVFRPGLYCSIVSGHVHPPPRGRNARLPSRGSALSFPQQGRRARAALRGTKDSAVSLWRTGQQTQQGRDRHRHGGPTRGGVSRPVMP